MARIVLPDEIKVQQHVFTRSSYDSATWKCGGLRLIRYLKLWYCEGSVLEISWVPSKRTYHATPEEAVIANINFQLEMLHEHHRDQRAKLLVARPSSIPF